MTSDQPVLLDVDEAVAVVTINRPERLNAVDWDTAVQLVELFGRLRWRDDVRAIVLTGAGRSFCAGGDLQWVESGSLMGETAAPRMQRKSPFGPFADFVRAIVNVDKPVIAALHGHVIGVGLVFALACDRRFADETTRMSAIFVKRGLATECGMSYFLPRIAGVPMALKMVTTGAWVEAEEAKRTNLIDELVPKGEDLQAALGYAKELARGPSIAMDLARRNIYKGLSSSFEEVIDAESFASMTAASSADAKEGVKAFLEKREPEFKGQ